MPERKTPSSTAHKMFECNKELASTLQSKFMANNLRVCVYTHAYNILERKKGKEEDNETLAQLKAFFFFSSLLPFFLIFRRVGAA